MLFANPVFLFGLAALAIPVLIHLFNFRRYKKVWFTNVRFLQELQIETKKQSRLRQLLILLARLLAIAALVMAFARPYIPAPGGLRQSSAQQEVSIYIDNSFSMDAMATDGKLIEVARARAAEIAEAYSASDRFRLLTNDFEGRHERFVSRDEFIRFATEVQVSPATRNMTEVIRRLNDLPAGSQGMDHDAYLLSDFQRNTGSLAEASPDTSSHWFLVPLAAEKRNNLFIDTVFFSSPVHQAGQPVTLNARIFNASAEALEKIPVKLTINGVQKALASFSVEAGGTASIALPFTENAPGTQYGLVEITDYPVVYDDRFYLAWEVLPSIPVLAIHENEPDPYLDALFSGDSAIRFSGVPVRRIDYGSLYSKALLVLEGPAELPSGLRQELKRYLNSGGTVAVFPPAAGKLQDYNEFLAEFNLPGFGPVDTVRQRIAGINAESDLYNDVFEKSGSGRVVLPENVDLPVVFRHYALGTGTQTRVEVLLRLRNDRPFLITSPAGKGRIYLFAVPLNDKWSLFPKHTIFVPTLYKIALLSNPSRPLYFPCGGDAAVEIPADTLSGDEIFKVRKQDSGYEIIPEIRKMGTGITLLPHGQVKEAGFYEVTQGAKAIAGLAFNFDRRESDLACYTQAELSRQISRLPVKDIRILKEKKTPLTREIRQIRQGTQLWQLFVALALVFIACEIALVRFFRA